MVYTVWKKQGRRFTKPLAVFLNAEDAVSFKRAWYAQPYAPLVSIAVYDGDGKNCGITL